VHVIFVALSTARRQQTLRDIRFLLDHDGRATLVTTKGSVWTEVPPSVRLEELADAESRHWFVRGERALVFRAPDLLLRVVRKLLLLAARFTRLDAFEHAAGTVDRLRARQQHAAKRFHKERFARFYRNVRPYVLWRAARSVVLPRLDLTDVDAVVVADSLSTPVGWHLAKDHPRLPVWFSLDRERVQAQQIGEAASRVT
jgi:hypothetical protein